MARVLPVVVALLGAALCVAAMSGERMVALSEGSSVPQNWQEVNIAVDYTGTVNLTVALKRRNLEQFEKEVTERSNPKSPSYGKWFTQAQINEMTAPLPTSLQAVLAWLQQTGVKSARVGVNRDTITMEVPLTIAEKILDLQFRTYQNVNTKKTLVRAVGAIRLPESVSKYVQAIVGASGFPILHSAIRSSVERWEQSETALDDASSGSGNPTTITVDPSVIVKRYNVSITAPVSPDNLKAVAEFQGQYITQTDVCKFYKSYNVSGDCKIHAYIGINLQGSPGVESTLDVEYMDGVAGDVPLDFYIFGGMDFCLDMTEWTTKILASSKAAYVHSVSYGAQDYTPICDSSVRSKIDQDFMTLSGKGITIVIASGDSGSGQYSRSGYNNGFLVPSWPAESPWCTSVGATFFVNGDLNKEGATTQFGSGGGFSWNEKTQPAWQADAVSTFFKNYPKASLPPAKSYNPTGRATPDVAALGENYVLILSGQPYPGIGGTSCSTPVFGGMVTRLNDIRLLKGKATLGCINQLIYQNPSAFYDVTIGTNAITPNTIGWKAVPGWDPVTGLGTPDYSKLEAIVKALN